MSASPTFTRPVGHLSASLDSKVVLPGDERFDEARRAWNLAIDQRPAAVIFPESATAVAAVLGYARRSRTRWRPGPPGRCTSTSPKPNTPRRRSGASRPTSGYAGSRRTSTAMTSSGPTTRSRPFADRRALSLTPDHAFCEVGLVLGSGAAAAMDVRPDCSCARGHIRGFCRGTVAGPAPPGGGVSR